MFFLPPPAVGGLDLNSSNSGCAHLGSGVAPPLGVVKEEVAVLIALIRSCFLPHLNVRALSGRLFYLGAQRTLAPNGAMPTDHNQDPC